MTSFLDIFAKDSQGQDVLGKLVEENRDYIISYGLPYGKSQKAVTPQWPLVGCVVTCIPSTLSLAQAC